MPLGDTVAAMEGLRDAGLILRWGVSNLGTSDMEELAAAAGTACATDQILYNLTRRGPELDLLPWLEARSIPAMAYSPVEQGRLVGHEGLRAIRACDGQARRSVRAVSSHWLGSPSGSRSVRRR